MLLQQKIKKKKEKYHVVGDGFCRQQLIKKILKKFLAIVANLLKKILKNK